MKIILVLMLLVNGQAVGPLFHQNNPFDSKEACETQRALDNEVLDRLVREGKAEGYETQCLPAEPAARGERV